MELIHFTIIFLKTVSSLEEVAINWSNLTKMAKVSFLAMRNLF